MADSAGRLSDQAQIIITALGGLGGGAALREMVVWFFGRGKHDAEARKLNAEAERALNELVDDRIKILLDAYVEENAGLKKDLARVWRYVEALRAHAEQVRAKLVIAGIEAPSPPVFDHGPEPPREMPPLAG